MDIVLDALENRIDQILSVAESLRVENETLRTRVAALEADKLALTRKIDIAASRLETLMERLPAE